MSTTKGYYEFVFVDLADPRVNNWLFMSTPFNVVTIIAAYLSVIYFVLPSYMVNRNPYKLKTVIDIYNVIQVVSCIFLIYGVTTSGWTTRYTFGCELCDFSENEMSLRLASYVWWTMILKLIEMMETVFFVLRKKYNQVTILHVYHHSTTFFAAWVCVKFCAGGMPTLHIILNCFIHVLMYSYYFLSARGPEMQQRLKGLKRKLTLAQLAQLCLFCLHTGQVFLPSCRVSKVAGSIYLFNLLINIVLFMNFYRNAYLKGKKN